MAQQSDNSTFHEREGFPLLGFLVNFMLWLEYQLNNMPNHNQLYSFTFKRIILHKDHYIKDLCSKLQVAHKCILKTLL
jgi:hypothetical protein